MEQMPSFIIIPTLERVVSGLKVELLDSDRDGFAAKITMNTEAGGTVITLSLDNQDLDSLKQGLANVEKGGRDAW
jgi:hypothetical protein